MSKRLKQEDGFTFIEIVGVLVIMGVLAAVAINRFADLQGHARDKAVYAAITELKTRLNSHFCNDLLDGKDPIAITYAEVDIYLGKDFEVTAWNPNGDDPLKITFTITYFPDPNDHSKNPLTAAGLVISKPLFGL